MAVIGALFGMSTGGLLAGATHGPQPMFVVAGVAVGTLTLYVAARRSEIAAPDVTDD